jgi:hypothetical protein
MDRDTAKLLGISRDLSHLGLELSNRETPLDEDVTMKIGEAMVALSEAIADISEALESGAQNNISP